MQHLGILLLIFLLWSNKKIRRWIIGLVIFSIVVLTAQAKPYIVGGIIAGIVVAFIILAIIFGDRKL